MNVVLRANYVKSAAYAIHENFCSSNAVLTHDDGILINELHSMEILPE